MNRTKRVVVGILLTALLPAAPAALFAANPRPNIVIFLVDDMGVMDTSVPFLTDDAGRPKRYPLNDYYRTPPTTRIRPNRDPPRPSQH